MKSTFSRLAAVATTAACIMLAPQPQARAEDTPAPFAATFTLGTGVVTFAEADLGPDWIGAVQGAVFMPTGTGVASTITVSMVSGIYTGTVDTFTVTAAAGGVWAPPLVFYVRVGESLRFVSGATNVAGFVKGWTD